MKTIINIIFCTAIFIRSSIAQTDIVWSAPVTVADASYDNLHPRLATDKAGNALVIWGDAIGDNVFLSRWNGSNFSTPFKINPEEVDVFAADWAGPDLAASGDTVYVVYKQQPEDFNPIYVCRSFDGGNTFSAPFPVENIADSLSRFPTVAVDATGNPVVGFMKFNADFLDSRWAVSISNDCGTTFSTDVKASGFVNDEVCDCCPGSLAVDGDTIAMLYRNNKNNYRTMWAGVSSDNGVSFSTGFPVDDTNWSLNICPSSGPDGIIVNDTLYAVFMSGAEGANRVYLNKSTLDNPQGTSSSMLTGNFTGLASQNYPRISNAGDAVAIVWKQVVNNGAQIAILFSDQIQAGFSTPYGIVASSTANNIANADVAVTNEKVHVAWQNNSNGTVQYISGTWNTTGIASQIVKDFSVDITPNPSAQFIKVKTSAPAAVTLYTLQGQKLNIPFDPLNNEINVSSIDNGMYLLKVQHDQQFTIEKIMIQH